MPVNGRLVGAIESDFALSTQQTFVLVMFSDPKPDHGALLHDSYGAVLPIDPHGPDIAFLIHFFHAQGTVLGIPLPKLVRIACFFPNILGQGHRQAVKRLSPSGNHDPNSIQPFPLSDLPPKPPPPSRAAGLETRQRGRPSAFPTPAPQS